MDDQDARTINQQIENIYSNLNNVTYTLSHEHSINFKMIERFNNITSHINNEQHTIERYMLSTTNKIKQEEDILLQTQYLNQINYNIDLLTHHLTNIAEAVVLSKLNIISRFLLSPEELENIEVKLKQKNIEVRSIENIYEMLGMQAYYNETNIIFNILVPNVSEEDYFLYHIIPLPINITKLIITEPYILFNENSTHHHKTLCPSIEGTYYCGIPIRQEETKYSLCIGNLINNKEANCPISDVGKRESITQVEQNLILFIHSPETLINSTCSIKTLTVKDTALVRFQNCDVSINGITYHDDTDAYWDQLHIPPLPNSNISVNSTIEILSLQKLEDFNFLTNNRISNLEITTTTVHSVTTTTTLPITPTTTSSLWPSLYLKGGGVTTPTLLSPPKPVTTPTLLSPPKPVTTPTLLSPPKPPRTLTY
ncbi:uncharacterized protein LOC131995379 isoform X2 [Stomoxys calcitrans]|uniref:uncharacterized protein LOC131995379 isoform X2 n=1 Tax=Stomoxys calcitrans TaxID=35570 RepID=UPI0027E2701C|nr:uncharacterized protein LOC131995379 isoform X2 [Stomoxys calcitrans]